MRFDESRPRCELCPYSTQTTISTNCHELIHFRILEDLWNFAHFFIFQNVTLYDSVTIQVR